MSSEVTRMSSSANNTSASNTGFQNNMGQISEDPNSQSDVKPVSIFSNDYKKHDDLKQMLDSNKDNLKLDAMKRIVGMIAKGKNASDLFPAVVKNVVSKNVEIKKLVYVYLMRYAEEQQDLALLSISTFQRALKDPNQLIRASALRVLSSIRVPIIVTIMMLAIKEAVTDMSPYVRKTAANAITKLYSLEPDLKEDLVGIIEKLLADKTILVAGSAIQAFEEVCPERIDLIHKNYRKLCNLLIDVDEWGQVIIINMLTRYARTQFVNPNIDVSKDESKVNLKEVNSLNDDDEDYDLKFSEYELSKKMDQDHRLLLRVTKPLLQSRNSAVVMAVAQLYYYIAPRSELQIIAKPLVRLLRSHREVQILVLKNIVSIAQKKNEMFQQHQKSFYVHSTDCIHVKLLKLEILTCLANESNISIILREFQAYVLSNDKEFAAATIHAIGRCASSIKEVAENCLTGLVNLMSKKDETIVAESVVVIKRLLQSNPAKNGHIIKKMAKMCEKVTVPMARASILWLIGEYSDRVNKIAPDILRKMAKSFCEEENIVKLQTINLAAKLFVTNPKQTTLLVQYILNLAKYDQNYDIRDRARYIRTLLFNNDKCPVFGKHLKKIILVSKPAPVLQSIYKDSDQFQLSTLSHAISSRVNGYTDLPDFPSEAPDPTVRNIEIPVEVKNERRTDMEPLSSKTHKGPSKSKTEKFYSDDDDDDVSTEGADPTNDEETDEDDENRSESEKENDSESEESSEEEEEEEDTENDQKMKKDNITNKEKSETESEESEEDSGSSETEESESSSEEEVEIKKTVAAKPANPQKNKTETINKTNNKQTSSEESSESSESSESESEESEPPEKPVKKNVKTKQTNEKTQKSQSSSNTSKTTTQKEISLLDLDFSESPSNPSLLRAVNSNSSNQASSTIVPVLSPALAADLANLSSSTSMNFSQQIVHSKKEYELLNKINGNGLQIQYKFNRANNSASSNKMVTIELMFNNFSNGDFSSFSITSKKLPPGISMSDFNEFDLAKNAQSIQKLSIDFNDTTQPVQFELTAIYSNDPLLGGTSNTRKWPNLSITCPIGELVQPGWSISENEFNKLQAKLKGMNEVNAVVDNLSHALFMSKNFNTKMLENFNMCQIPSSQQETIKYAALTTSSKTQLLLSLYFPNGSIKCHINVNCEKIVLANMFIKEVKQVLSST